MPAACGGGARLPQRPLVPLEAAPGARLTLADHSEVGHNFYELVEIISDLILVATAELTIVHFNGAVLTTLGYSVPELLGKRLPELCAPADRQDAEEMLAALGGGQGTSGLLSLQCRRGLRVPVEARVRAGQWAGRACFIVMFRNLGVEQEANLRFERLFRASPCPVALSSLPERTFIDVNEAFLQTLGFGRDEVIGKTAKDLRLFVQPDEQEALAATLYGTEHFSGKELLVRRKDGSVLVGLFSGEVVRFPSHNFLLTVMVNISERKANEAKFARLSQIQNALVRVATSFVNVRLEQRNAAIDQSLRIMSEVIGADLAYLIGFDADQDRPVKVNSWRASHARPDYDPYRVHQALDAHHLGALWRGHLLYLPDVAALSGYGREYAHLVAEGVMSLVVLPLMLGGQCLGFVGFVGFGQKRELAEEELTILKVVTEMYAHLESRLSSERQANELQARLTQARDAAQAAANAKSLFLANMSHEIRTPLNAILGYAQIMARTCRSCPEAMKLSSITRSGEHLLQLLNDLLELVRSDSQEIELEKVTIDLYQVVDDVRTIIMQHPSAQRLDIQIAINASVPRYVRSDPGKVRQILVNLMGNAVKFTESGYVRMSATVLAASTPTALRLAFDIDDTGCGVEPDQHAAIFDVFAQSNSGRRRGRGVGLGLPLSRRYARALGGDVVLAKSEIGRGSRFRFTFQVTVESSLHDTPSTFGAVVRLSSGQRSFRVLVVDDDGENRHVLSDMLSAVGFRVDMADSGSAAVTLVRSGGPYDLILLDKEMPLLGGYEVITQLRNIPGSEGLAVLIVTASADSGEHVLARAAGADGYISKPIRREQLLAEIGRVSGARYDFENDQSGAASGETNVAADMRELPQLPSSVVSTLKHALYRGDVRQMRDIVAEIAKEHPSLAARIRVLVDSYDYDKLGALLEHANRAGAAGHGGLAGGAE